MREIKFRAWEPNEGQMWYTDRGRGFTFCINDMGGQWIETLKGDSSRWQNVSDWMQYTGMKDKNGKEIYEGDILQCTPGVDTYRKCVWRDCEYFLIEVNVPRNLDFPLHAVSTSHRDAVVIGNVYETLELLTQ